MWRRRLSSSSARSSIEVRHGNGSPQVRLTEPGRTPVQIRIDACSVTALAREPLSPEFVTGFGGVVAAAVVFVLILVISNAVVSSKARKEALMASLSRRVNGVYVPAGFLALPR